MERARSSPEKIPQALFRRKIRAGARGAPTRSFALPPSETQQRSLLRRTLSRSASRYLFLDSRTGSYYVNEWSFVARNPDYKRHQARLTRPERANSAQRRLISAILTGTGVFHAARRPSTSFSPRNDVLDLYPSAARSQIPALGAHDLRAISFENIAHL